MAGLDFVRETLEDVTDIIKRGLDHAPLRATVMVKTESGHGLNVRAEPNEGSDKVGKLADKQKVVAVNYITPTDSDYSWAAIYLSSDDKLAVGYAAAKYLVIPEDDPEGENNIAQSDLPSRAEILDQAYDLVKSVKGTRALIIDVAITTGRGLSAAVVKAIVGLADILAMCADSVHDTMRAALLKSLVDGDTYETAAQWALEAAKAY